MKIQHSHIFSTTIILIVICFFPVRADEKPIWAYKDFSSYNSTRFVENKGQLTSIDGNIRNDIKFYLQSGNLTAYFTPNSIIYTFHKQVKDNIVPNNMFLATENNIFPREDVRSELEYFICEMKMKGANFGTRISGENANDEILNFYYSHCPQGILDVKSYKKIIYHNIYDNIDLVVYATGNKFGFKYDFIVHRNANPAIIKLEYENGKVEKAKDGTVEILCHNFKIMEAQPFSYQNINNSKKEISSKFNIAHTALSFNISDYDRTQDLVIDPVINWATYYGGSDGDHSHAIAIDYQANVVISGWTLSKNFPVTNGSRYTGALDLFVAKFDYTGKRLWATYYGGREEDYGYNVAIDSAAHIYVTGWTWDKNFPVTSGCFQSKFLGGKNEGVLIKFDRNGKRLWATYVGGSSEEHLYGLAIDKKFNVITAGWSRSRDFPNKKSAINTKRQFDDIALVSFNSSGEYQWSTFLGGDSVEMAKSLSFDISGNIILTGSTHSNNLTLTHDAQQRRLQGAWDAVVAKFSITGNLMYSSYLGGTLSDYGTAIATDSRNNIFVCGYTSSKDFPTTDKAFQKKNNGRSNCFITKFSQINSIKGSSYLGGKSEDYAYALTIDRSDNVIFTGQTSSPNFPITPNAVQHYLKGSSDVFGAKLTNNLTGAFWVTFYGGDDDDLGKGVATDRYQNIYITGYTKSTDFPVTEDVHQKDLAGQYDAFIFKHCATSPYSEININGKTTFCSGNSVELDAGSGFLFYEWSNGERSQKITVTKSGSYSVHITDSMYCDFTSEPILINVLPLPKPKIQGNPKICEGDSAVLTIPDGTKTWEWSNGSKARTIVLQKDQRIILAVTNDNNCTGYDTVYVKHYPRPKPLIHGPSSVCINSMNMEYFVYGTAGNSYRWKIIGGTINTGVDYFNIRVDWTAPGKGMLIIAETNNASDCIGIDTLIVNVTDHLIPEITSDKNRFIMCEGDSMTLNAGSGYSKYLWNTGSDKEYIGVKKAGKYFVRVLAGSDCEGYDTVVVKTRPAPTPFITGDTALCEGSYDVTYSSIFNPEHKYYWKITNGEITKNDSSNTITVNWLKSGKGKITLIQYDTLTECSGSAEIEVTVHSKPNANINALGDVEFCDGDSVILDAGSGFKTYKWNTGDTSRLITVKQAGVFSVYVANEYDCTNSDSIKITVFPKPSKPIITNVEDTLFSTLGDIYIWYRNDTLLKTIHSPWFVSHTDGKYRVIHRNLNGCESKSDIFTYKYVPIVGLSYISMPDTIFVRTGDAVVIPISIKKSKLLDKIMATNFVASLSFDGAVLVPDDIKIPFTQEKNIKTITIKGKRNDTVGVIYTLYLHAALGDSICTDIVLDSLSWDSYRDVEVIKSICTVCIENICKADGNRFYIDSGILRLEQNRPNPAQEHTTIEFETIETGYHRLKLIDVYGKDVMTIFKGDIKPGIRSIKINTANIASGVYYYILQTPTRIIRAKMQIIK